MNSFLRSLSFEQQIQLLFLLLVTLLIVLGLIINYLAQQDKKKLSTDDVTYRAIHRRYRLIIKFSWIMTMVFWLAWLGGVGTATILFALVSFWILREFITISKTETSDHYGISIAFFIALPVQYLLAWQMSWVLFIIFIPIIMFLIIPLINALSGDVNNFPARVEKIHMGLMVCVYGLSHIPALMNINFMPAKKAFFLPIFLVMVVMVCMLIQFLLFRFKPIQPSLSNISYSFTWKYCLIGIVCGTILGVLLSPLTPLKPGNAAFMAMLACAAGTGGSIILQASKRSYGITAWKKDVFDSSPAMLDKIGPLCFAAPVFFHSIMFYFDLF